MSAAEIAVSIIRFIHLSPMNFMGTPLAVKVGLEYLSPPKTCFISRLCTLEISVLDLDSKPAEHENQAWKAQIGERCDILYHLSGINKHASNMHVCIYVSLLLSVKING